MKKEEVQNRIKEVIVEVLQDDEMKPEDIGNEDPFFGTDEEPGVIQDSLLILEIVSILSDEYDIDPSEFNEETFINVEIVSNMIMEKMTEVEG